MAKVVHNHSSVHVKHSESLSGSVRFETIGESISRIKSGLECWERQTHLEHTQRELFETELTLSLQVNELLAEEDAGRRVAAAKDALIGRIAEELRVKRDTLSFVREEQAYLKGLERHEAGERPRIDEGGVDKLRERVEREESMILELERGNANVREGFEDTMQEVGKQRHENLHLQEEVDALERERHDLHKILEVSNERSESTKQKGSYQKYELRRQAEDLKLVQSDMEVALKKLKTLELICENLTKENFSLQEDIEVMESDDSRFQDNLDD